MPARLLARPARSIALATAVAALSLAGCGSAEAAAATINGHKITDKSFQRELRALRDNKKLAETLAQNGQKPISTSKNAIDPELTAAWLTAVLQQDVVDREFARKHLKVSAQAKKDAPAFTTQQFVSKTVFDAFPKWFRDLEQHRFERLLTLAGPKPSEAELRAQFEQLKAKNCPSGKLVSHILVASKAEADAIEQQLAGGTDFATLASQKSTDTQSAQQGGQVGCLTPGQFDKAFEDAATALPAGQVSAPVQTQFGWHVIKATDLTFETAGAQVEQQALSAQFQKLSASLGKKLTAAKVTINPRYGKVEKKPQFRVVPPKQPKVKEKPSASTTAGDQSTPSSTAPAGSQGSTPSSTGPAGSQSSTPQPTG